MAMTPEQIQYEIWRRARERAGQRPTNEAPVGSPIPRFSREDIQKMLVTGEREMTGYLLRPSDGATIQEAQWIADSIRGGVEPSLFDLEKIRAGGYEGFARPGYRKTVLGARLGEESRGQNTERAKLSFDHAQIQGAENRLHERRAERKPIPEDQQFDTSPDDLVLAGTQAAQPEEDFEGEGTAPAPTNTATAESAPPPASKEAAEQAEREEAEVAQVEEALTGEPQSFGDRMRVGWSDLVGDTPLKSAWSKVKGASGTVGEAAMDISPILTALIPSTAERQFADYVESQKAALKGLAPGERQRLLAEAMNAARAQETEMLAKQARGRRLTPEELKNVAKVRQGSLAQAQSDIREKELEERMEKAKIVPELMAKKADLAAKRLEGLQIRPGTKDYLDWLGKKYSKKGSRAREESGRDTDTAGIEAEEHVTGLGTAGQPS